MVIFLAAPVAPLRSGILGAEEGITISDEEVGIPPHQLPAVFQFVLITPIQVPVAVTDKVAVADVTEPQVPLTTTS